MTLLVTSRIPGHCSSRHRIGWHGRWLLCGLSLQLIVGCSHLQLPVPQSADPAPAGRQAHSLPGNRGTPSGTEAADAAQPATGSSWGDSAIKAAVCGAVAFGGVKLAKRLVEWEAKTKSLSAKDKEQKQRSYMAGFALIGCSIGVNLTSKVLANLSESARQAQNQAWHQAQQGASNKVEWSAPDASGSTQLTDVQTASNGKSCGIRRDVIRSNQGEETALIPVCKGPGEKEYTPSILVV